MKVKIEDIKADQIWLNKRGEEVLITKVQAVKDATSGMGIFGRSLSTDTYRSYSLKGCYLGTVESDDDLVSYSRTVKSADKLIEIEDIKANQVWLNGYGEEVLITRVVPSKDAAGMSIFGRLISNGSSKSYTIAGNYLSNTVTDSDLVSYKRDSTEAVEPTTEPMPEAVEPMPEAVEPMPEAVELTPMAEAVELTPMAEAVEPKNFAYETNEAGELNIIEIPIGIGREGEVEDDNFNINRLSMLDDAQLILKTVAKAYIEEDRDIKAITDVLKVIKSINCLKEK